MDFRQGAGLSGIAKRLFDIVASAAAAVANRAVDLAVSRSLIKLESKGPAFYRQQRVGLLWAAVRRVQTALHAFRC